MPLLELRRFNNNPKKHDLGKIAESIIKYGFKDPVKLEPSLNNGEGGIVEGNGRTEALVWMKEQGQEVPRGIIGKKGKWLVPVLIGVDAVDELEAQAYALDHNNLSLLGGGLTALDASNMYDSEAYLGLLVDLNQKGQEVIAVDGDDLDLLLNQKKAGVKEPPDTFPEYGEDIEIEYCCPKCRYQWSGNPK